MSGSYRFSGMRIPAGLLFALLSTQIALPETGLSVLQKPGIAPESNPVRADIDAVLTTLNSVVIKEKISRFTGVGDAARKLDSFETEVSIADGTEQYYAVRGHHRTYHHVSEIGGLWSFGEIVTMLRTTREIIDSPTTTGDHPEGETAVEGVSDSEETSTQTLIRFQSASAAHKWFVTAHGRVYWLDFEGTIRISRKTGKLERLTWTSCSGPPETGIASILWDVNFGPATIADGGMPPKPPRVLFPVRRCFQDHASAPPSHVIP